MDRLRTLTLLSEDNALALARARNIVKYHEQLEKYFKQQIHIINKG